MYVYERFDPLDGTSPITLPRYGELDSGSGGVASDAQQLIGGGAVPRHGYDQLRQQAAAPVFRSRVLAAPGGPSLQTQIDLLQSAIGKMGKLFAREDGGNLRWKYARLLGAPWTRTDGIGRQQIDLSWQLYDTYWRGTHHSAGWTLDSGVLLDTGRGLDEAVGSVFDLVPGSNLVTTTNRGNAPVLPMRITITNKTGSGQSNMSAVSIASIDTGGSLDWVQHFLRPAPDGLGDYPIQPGGRLIVDSGMRAVLSYPTGLTLDPYDSYGGTTGYVTWPWMRPGNVQFAINITGAGAGALGTFEFDDAFA